MDEEKTQIEIELSEDDWSVLEECRLEAGFDTMDDLISYILEKELERYNISEINDSAVNL
jgi:hypothetical protein